MREGKTIEKGKREERDGRAGRADFHDINKIRVECISSSFSPTDASVANIGGFIGGPKNLTILDKTGCLSRSSR
jgi:hypothetical protein